MTCVCVKLDQRLVRRVAADELERALNRGIQYDFPTVDGTEAVCMAVVLDDLLEEFIADLRRRAGDPLTSGEVCEALA